MEGVHHKKLPRFGLTARAIAVGATILAAGAGQTARATSLDEPVKIGVLTDIASSNGDNAGMGSVEAARMAIEDFHGMIAGKPVELVFANHQGKPDIGAEIARDWLDNKGVTAIVDVPQSAVALAVMPLAERANAAVLLSGAGDFAITGKSFARGMLQAGVYSAVHHYLVAAQASSTVAGDKVVAQMKAMPVDDMFTSHGIAREGGQMVRDVAAHFDLDRSSAPRFLRTLGTASGGILDRREGPKLQRRFARRLRAAAWL